MAVSVISPVGMEKFYRGHLIGNTYDLNDLYENEHSGFYTISTNVKNCPWAYSFLIVLARNETLAYQILFYDEKMAVRKRSGAAPRTWSAWKYIDVNQAIT